MMQGNLSGVNITNASGMPGGAVRVSIRGVGSINGSNEPLFVIDGIPVSNSDNSGVNGRFGGSVQNPLSMLNPNDIESIDVLKDRGGNGHLWFESYQRCCDGHHQERKERPTDNRKS